MSRSSYPVPAEVESSTSTSSHERPGYLRVSHDSNLRGSDRKTTAASESSLSARIARGDCLKHECDGGKAWSLYQIHSNLQNAHVWGSPDLAVQTNEALRMLKQAAARCPSFKSVPRATCIVRAYAGRSPDMPLRKEEQRLAMFNRVLRRL